MISDYLEYKDSFNDIVENDPIKNSWGKYWFLKSHPNQNYILKDDIFSPDEILRILTIGKRFAQENASVGNNVLIESIRRSKVSWILPNEVTEWIYRYLTDVVNQVNDEFFKYDLTMMESLQFTFYKEEDSGFYTQHLDSLVWNKPHNRKLSFVVQLSDPSEYDGGDLKIHYSHNPVTIPKQKGLAVFFPSFMLHEVTEVTRGNRHTLVGWVHGPSFK
jgi:PKHD-type hydroxylase